MSSTPGGELWYYMLRAVRPQKETLKKGKRVVRLFSFVFLYPRGDMDLYLCCVCVFVCVCVCVCVCVSE